MEEFAAGVERFEDFWHLPKGSTAMLPLIGQERAVVRVLATEGVAAETSTVTAAGRTSKLYYYGPQEFVKNKLANGMLAGGPGTQGRFWATTDANAGMFSLSTGGSFVKNGKIFVDMSARMELSAVDAALFRPAYGLEFSWDPTSWWKGVAGHITIGLSRHGVIEPPSSEALA
jgi:hypothetical protein